MTEVLLGMYALAHSWPRGLCKYAFLPASLLAQILCKIKEDFDQVWLVAPYWPTRTWFSDLMVFMTAPTWQTSFLRDEGTIWHLSRSLESPCAAPG